ncbi:MAG: decarboxylase [Nanoarchaeota archaeon]|nr:decarboxylase [Nanoarchaeota archaeon]
MSEAKFILSKKVVKKQYDKLKNLGLKVSYSYKTNPIIAKVLEEITDSDFSIHRVVEITKVKDKSKIWFFAQAWNQEEIRKIIKQGVNKFVIDNPNDLEILLNTLNKKVTISLRMKFQERRVQTGKYYVYGMASKKIEELVNKIHPHNFVEKIGIHIHRKSQNTSEWEILPELQDSISNESWEKISFVNLGGGLPSKYRSSTIEVLPYIFEKLSKVKNWLKDKNIQTYIEPGRFIAAPAVKLVTEIIQIHENNIIINSTVYNCALDSVLTGTKLLVENELEESQEGEVYLIKGNSPTRDDIFRYKVRLSKKEVGDKLVFVNAGAYNYSTDFFGYEKFKTEILEKF